MVKIYELLLIITALFGFYLSFMLFFVSRQNKLLNRLLAIFMVNTSLFFFLHYCVSQNWIPDVVILIRTFLPLYYFLPATCFLYFRSFIHDDTKLSKKDLIHLLPLLFHFIYISPLIYSLITSDHEWKHMITHVDNQTYFFNKGPLPDVFHVVLRLSLMVTYIGLIWKSYLSKQYREFVAKNKSDFPFAVKWIKYFIIVVSIHGIFSLFKKMQVFFFHGEKTLFFGDLISVGYVLSFAFLVFYVIANPVILFGLPHFTKFLPADANTGNNIAAPLDNAPPTMPLPALEITDNIETADKKQNTKESSTDDQAENMSEKMRLLIHRMHEFIATQQPFRDPEFSTTTLSKSLNVPQHHIAYIFKQALKQSFVEFRNELRVQYVIEALKKGTQSSHTIEGIGTEAGFTSRASFYSVFKKHTGKTPGQYVEEVGG
jgi:AraC-like DNA-binding protein